MAWVYILQEKSGGRFYIGSTSHLQNRISHHKGSFTHSTRRFESLELVFSQEFPTLTEARGIEMRLKKMKRRDYIETIVREGKIKMRP